ncbi:MAG: hypothetical protein ACREO4_13020 [Lysobacter sp.]
MALQPHELKTLAIELASAMPPATYGIDDAALNDLHAAMGDIDAARVIAMLAEKSEGLDANDARTVFRKLLQLMGDVYNQIDHAIERLEV